MDRTPRQGEFYRHFKNKLYQIVAVAVHSETGEPMVVYQALYGDFGMYVRPLDMFVSEVDHEKYPEAAQQYRFERVEINGDHAGSPDEKPPARGQEENSGPGGEPNTYLMEFLEADSYDGRIAALEKMEGHVGRQEVDSIRAVLELEPGTGDVRDQLKDIRKYMEIQGRYDGSRLRSR